MNFFPNDIALKTSCNIERKKKSKNNLRALHLLPLRNRLYTNRIRNRLRQPIAQTTIIVTIIIIIILIIDITTTCCCDGEMIEIRTRRRITHSNDHYNTRGSSGPSELLWKDLQEEDGKITRTILNWAFVYVPVVQRKYNHFFFFRSSNSVYFIWHAGINIHRSILCRLYVLVKKKKKWFSYIFYRNIWI